MWWPPGLSVLVSDRVIWVEALLNWDIALCPWAKHFTPTLPISTLVYKWLLVNLMLGRQPCNVLQYVLRYA